MKSTFRWITLSFTVVLFLGLAQAKPNFSGEWKMVPAKSDFGPMPPPASILQKITHNDPDLKIVSTYASDRGEFTLEFSYTTDGKECSNTLRMGQINSTLKWDGDTLIIESKMEFQGNPASMTEKWTLSEDGKALTVNGHFSGSMGDADSRVVFEK